MCDSRNIMYVSVTKSRLVYKGKGRAERVIEELNSLKLSVRTTW